MQESGRGAQSVDPRAAFSPDPAAPAAFLAACPAYKETPLRRLVGDGALAGCEILVKDEAQRFGLNAHKALGGVYAVARMIETRWRAAGGGAVAPAELTGADVRAVAGGLTFVCASAGNHGLSVAAGAALFGARARVHLTGSAPGGFAQRLAAKGAEIVRSAELYDDCLAAAAAEARAGRGILLADTLEARDLAPDAPEGAAEAPALVMEGYTVIAEELRARFERGGDWPDLVALPGGVGGTAGAIAHMIRATWAVQPTILVVEPEAAPCLAASRAAGQPIRVEGPSSAMGRLDCKAPSLLGFEALERSKVAYVAVSDADAQGSADWLGARGLPTTPSGAASLAGVFKQPPPAGRVLVLMGEGA